MGKGKKKKKHSLKEEVSEDLLDAAAVSVRKFRKVTKEVYKLSTGQKIVGGLALLAAGLTYLAKMEFDSNDKADAPKPDKSEDKKAAPIASSPEFARLAAADFSDDEAAAPASKPSAARKSRKPPKTKHED
ncbi:hypothetical protein [Hymenobacter arizonensis]|uniref:Uncharacterized protein n=1 Tax=Hymenobacter arizonensis TaxID=1227077 RepID=A0A1I6AEA7_HYMAR|nr:hypothetical protein [Hymenobacter arizonensis]SFQ66995.1 hypothetical protein SAMN04515668_3595 [Hymenobacter arizonensis]